MKSPNSRYFQADVGESLLIIRPEEEQDLAVRILHTDYNFDSGVKVSVGSRLGKMVRSGFFNFWTERHIHVEVRSKKHLLRAKGSLPLTPSTRNSKLSGVLCEKPPNLRIVCVNKDYILADVSENGIMTLNPFKGFGCKIGKTRGILGD